MATTQPEPCIVIPRVISYRNAGAYAAWLDHETRTAIDLFLPHDPANRGNVVIWDGGHNEAHLTYYWRTKVPRTPAQVKAAAKAVARYRAFMESIPESDRQPVVERKRLPHDWRERAWRDA